MLKKFVSPSLSIGGVVVRPVSTVRNLGVVIDGSFIMHPHVNALSRSCFYQLRRLRLVK